MSALSSLTKAQLIALIENAPDVEPQARVTIASLRASGAFACGVAGHGKNDDGNFATITGATFHATKCKAMAKALKARS